MLLAAEKCTGFDCDYLFCARLPAMKVTAAINYGTKRKPATSYRKMPNLGLISDIRYYFARQTEEILTNPEKNSLTSKMEVEIDLLKRHVAVLKAIIGHQPIGILKLSEQLNYPQHKVRYSLRILEQEGLIIPSPNGAVTTAEIRPFLEHLKGVLMEMSQTVNELKTVIGD